MYRADYHIHTAFSQDSKAPVEAQIEEAIRQNFDEIAITDHMEKEPINGINQFNMCPDDYVAAIQKMQEKYKDKIKVRVGIEIGYEPRWHKELERLIHPNDFDFIICSTHKCEAQDMNIGKFFDGRTQIQGYSRYFEEVLNTIKSCPYFSVYGHMDYINRYGPFENKILNIKDYYELVDQILIALIESGKGLELNTSGIRYGLGHFNPQIEVLKMYLDRGGEIITIGSDSHFTEHIGFLWNEAAAMLKNIGFNYYTTFEHRAPVFHQL